ncbi:beta-phosphoglucomutase family hydrolase [Rhodococcus oryzae]|uniref:beta-phosphoglucomutase family hydrolase n=1 Tax=Rhodococcus oryzae TaxID=2571143 RepID=UPI0037A6B275
MTSEWRTEPDSGVLIAGHTYRAVLFDLDGVVTDTATLHHRAWKSAFDEFLARNHPAQPPFEIAEYRAYVDGRSRSDGVRSFLAARSISLPDEPDPDAANPLSVRVLAERKDQLFHDLLRSEGVRTFAPAVELLHSLHSVGVGVAVVSASRNAAQVLSRAGLVDEVDVRVDGIDAARLQLPGKPDPALFLEAARRLETAPNRTVVIEDAESGVIAAHKGDFGLVIGIAPPERASALADSGAQIVVGRLDELDWSIGGTVRAGSSPDSSCELCAQAISTAWRLDHVGFEPAAQGARESLFALGNGYLATRGALPEARADAVHYPGTYVAGCYNRVTSSIGRIERDDESIVNVPNWLPVAFRIDDGPWLTPEHTAMDHHHVGLDLRRGLLMRESVFRDPDGRRTRIRQRRLVSMATPHLAALETTIVAENWSGRLTVRSGLDGDIENTNVAEYRPLSGRHLESGESGVEPPNIMWLSAHTSQSRVRVVEACRTTSSMNDEKSGTDNQRIDASHHGIYLEQTFAAGRAAKVTVYKAVAIYTSKDRAISEPLAAAVQAVASAGSFDDLLTASAAAWNNLWARCEMTPDADHGTQQAANVDVFHVLQTLSPHTADLDVGVPARGLHGEAYRGHIFWDELFVFPFLTLRLPELTRALLLYRFRRLPVARQHARALGYSGALFPWQSGSDGREETPLALLNPISGRWVPDNSRRQFHINLAIVYNVWHYWETTGDLGFLTAFGAELLVENARFWASLATYDAEADRYDVRGVMGPDEFHDGYPDSPGSGIDNSAYINVMLAWSLARALDAHRILGPDADRRTWDKLGVDGDELRLWDHMARRLRLEFLDTGVLSQFEGYGRLTELPLDDYRRRYRDIGRLDLILEAEGDSTSRYQVSKQADVLMLLYLFSAEELTSLIETLGYAFDPAVIPATVDYYLERTTHGSTLSRIVHSWVLSRRNRRQSWQMLGEALACDLGERPVASTRKGIHLGAMAGSIDILQRCYSGIDVREGVLWLHPQLPTELRALAFDIHYRDHWMHIRCNHTAVTVSTNQSAAAPVRVAIHDTVHTLPAGATISGPA